MRRAQKSHTPVPEAPGGTQVASQSIRKRSVSIAGHRTSISLEGAFWATLRKIAAARDRSISELVTQIDREREGNLSSAIRVFVLMEVAAASGACDPPPGDLSPPDR